MTAVSEIVHAISIGASMIARICGLSRFGGPWAAWALLTGRIDPPERTPEMEWGILLQPVIAGHFSVCRNTPVEWFDKRKYSKVRPWQHATPDAFGVNEPRFVLEVKTANLSQSRDWGPTGGGESDIPEEYLVQVQWQLDVCELEEGYVAVLIGGSDFRWYHIRKDPELVGMLVDQGEYFWRRHILGGIEPEMGSSAEARQYLKRRYPREREKLRAATVPELEWLCEYRDVRSGLDTLEAKKAELENLLIRAVGDHEGLEFPDGKFTWKKTRDTSATDWERLARKQLEGYAEDEIKEMIAEHTHPVPGYRKIHFGIKKEAHV